MVLKKYLNKKVKGFSGITHLFCAIFLFLLLFLFPFGIIKDYIIILKSNWKIFITTFVILSGACLLPDLDNDVSTAGYQLGPFGTLFKTGMKTIAYVIYSIYHLKEDKTPKSMHRLFWHTPFIAILITIILYFTIPDSSIIVIDALKDSITNKAFLNYIVNNFSVFTCILLSFICAFLGSNILLYWPLKLIPLGPNIKSLFNFGLPIFISYLCLNFTYKEIKYIGIAIGLGYLFHILADLISQGSIPLTWPIPVKNQAYWKPKVLGKYQIETGGTVNLILNFIFLGIDLLLIYIIFIK